MKVQYINDEQRGRGYARFVCMELDASSPRFGFSLCRASDQTFLGKSGWQSAEEKHSPDACERENNATILLVGPSVVDWLDENENYRLTLFDEAVPLQRAAFSITNVNRSLRQGQGNVQSVPLPQPPPASETPPEEPRQEPEETLVIMPPPVSRGKFPAVAVAALILLLLLGGAVWWYMRQQSADAAPAASVVRQTQEQAEKPEKAASETGAAKASDRPEDESGKEQAVRPESGTPLESPAPQKPEENPPPRAQAERALTAREQVRLFLSDAQASPQGAMSLYQSLSQAPDGGTQETQDSVYRLLYFAAQKGDAEAAFVLAQCADPTTPPFGTIAKDGHEAWTRYAAVVGQKPEAARNMQTLKVWLENEAGRGSIQARQWIEAIARDRQNP
ncbi:MAG: hypothetical protein LBR31_08365 [Desulfovibrio sp.]|jgi:hypothetical protein|nr:hypothetical protein [Desulfovibrio sp.]